MPLLGLGTSSGALLLCQLPGSAMLQLAYLTFEPDITCMDIMVMAVPGTAPPWLLLLHHLHSM
jgi:hypothetical protein